MSITGTNVIVVIIHCCLDLITVVIGLGTVLCHTIIVVTGFVTVVVIVIGVFDHDRS